jgi:hypothetical protein
MYTAPSGPGRGTGLLRVRHAGGISEEPQAIAALARFRLLLLLRLASLYFLHHDPDAAPASSAGPRTAGRGFGLTGEREGVTPHASRRADSPRVADTVHATSDCCERCCSYSMGGRLPMELCSLDTFLASPLVWQLENARAAGERTGPAIRDEHSRRSGWTMSSAAMHLVLQSGGERREALRLVSEELAGRSWELVGAVTPPLAGLSTGSRPPCSTTAPILPGH